MQTKLVSVTKIEEKVLLNTKLVTFNETSIALIYWLFMLTPISLGNSKVQMILFWETFLPGKHNNKNNKLNFEYKKKNVIRWTVIEKKIVNYFMSKNNIS